MARDGFNWNLCGLEVMVPTTAVLRPPSPFLQKLVPHRPLATSGQPFWLLVCGPHLLRSTISLWHYAGAKL
jgi:hypothetical protein